ncbi:M48 family metalloprotease [Tabrizicola sp.]|jgi:Zn-dependent protease with chaperone function|uniref:M48 family metallopeptidase n=1 Tax=Tabrizicola sp. TaxID=2005166 RepID=UPI0035AF7986
MRLLSSVLLSLALAGCVSGYAPPSALPVAATAAPDQPARIAAENFLAVVSRVEPVAERYCRDRGAAKNCDFRIVIDDRPGQPPNAFQTVDSFNRPVIGFTVALIMDARNQDELAFVLGHEAAHHVEGHIPKRQDQAMSGALMAGILAQASGLTPEEVQQAQTLGAEVAARSYSKDFELQADALGAEIALVAGFDPVRGTAFFDRLPDPGDRFLGSHPPNAARKAVVAATVRRLTGS